MNIILKKTPLFTVIIILCLVAVTLFAVNGCGESETLSTNYTNGIIVGHTKCNVDSDSTLIGLFIITEKKDSLLSFNASLSSIGIDPNSLNYGVYDFCGCSISFSYRIAIGEEIEQTTNFLCPQNAMLPGFSYGQIEDYKQIIINDIKLETQ
jgi:hypothetical protein